MAVLCDGAGTGKPAREAAVRAVETLPQHYRARPRSWEPERAVLECTRVLNRALYQESRARFERVEMVATLAVVVIEGDRLWGLNLGDSSVYLWRAGVLETLSVAHVDTLQTSMLTQALGMTEVVEPHGFTRELQDGDVVLLCSDGVSNHVSEEALASLLQGRATAASIVDAARALAQVESLDDMSAVVLDIQQTGKLRAMKERSLEIPAALQKGLEWDGYTLVRSFQGSDRVWLAEKDGQRVVVKFAPLEAAEHARYLDAFTFETWNATRVSTHHFVHAWEPPGQTARYYVMEFVDAPSLAAVLLERMLSVDSAVALGAFLAEAMQILLRLDLAHGDLKPENILCIGDYARLDFKLVDLGSATPLFAVASRAGTASYLAPERFQGAAVSERTEIFAVGVTLYQALTKQWPFGEIERFQTPTFATAPRVTRLNPNVPPWLDTVIARALAIPPEQRYQHYSELAFDLANPTKVQPLHDAGAPLLVRNPLLFYKVGFWLLALVCGWLAVLLLGRS